MTLAFSIILIKSLLLLETSIPSTNRAHWFNFFLLWASWQLTGNRQYTTTLEGRRLSLLLQGIYLLIESRHTLKLNKLCIHIIFFLVICWWLLGLVPYRSCEQCNIKHGYAKTSVIGLHCDRTSLTIYQSVVHLGHKVILSWIYFLENSTPISVETTIIKST